MNSNYYYSNILVSGKNKAFLEILQRLADEGTGGKVNEGRRLRTEGVLVVLK